LGQHGVTPRPSTSNDVLFPYLMFDDIRERFNEFNPFSMPTIQFCLTSNVFQGLMIRMYNKFFGP